MQFSTKREIFEYVVTQLWRQGEQAYDEMQDACAYRWETDDGRVLKCAAGHLIEDDIYDPLMEGKDFGRLIKEVTKDLNHLKPFTNFITDLQNMHDSIEPRYGYSFRRALKSGALELAHEHNLSTDFIDKLEQEQ